MLLHQVALLQFNIVFYVCKNIELQNNSLYPIIALTQRDASFRGQQREFPLRIYGHSVGLQVAVLSRHDVVGPSRQHRRRRRRPDCY